MSDTTTVYYDPFDFDIDTDPYPIWKQLREEAPLYYNEKYDFYALSRFEDVETGLKDWATFSSSKGTLLELIKADIDMPPGSIIFEDPPSHDLHRGLLSRVFTPRKMAAIEPKVRDFCARALDPLVGAGGFDVVADLGAQMPMRTIGMLLGIPDEDQEALRDNIDQGLKLTDGEMPTNLDIDSKVLSELADYLDYRYANPSDDLMSELIQAEYTDLDGQTRRLTRDEALNFINLVAAAGNETTNRLIGWTTKILAEHPDQRAEIAADRSLIPQTIEEVLRFEPPSPVQARLVMRDVELYGQVVPAGSAILLLNASANRDHRRFEDPDVFDIHRPVHQHLSFGFGIHFCLGAALARLEGRVALDEMLDRFPTWEIDHDNAVQARTSTVRGWEKLPIITP